MVQTDFVVTDDFVVEVSHVQRAISTLHDVDRSKPRIVAGHKIGFFNQADAIAINLKAVAVDAAGHHVAGIELALEVERKMVGLVISNAADCRAAVQVIHNCWHKT